MDFDTYKILHSETLMYYQKIEHNLKCIYAYMREGKVDDNFEKIENVTLGQVIKKLQDLDNSDGNPLISAGDYNFLSQIKDNRNLWAHHNFIEFIYEKDFSNSKKYKKQCERLQRDHDRVSRACSILEEIKEKYCSSHKR